MTSWHNNLLVAVLLAYEPCESCVKGQPTLTGLGWCCVCFQSLMTDAQPPQVPAVRGNAHLALHATYYEVMSACLFSSCAANLPAARHKPHSELLNTGL